MLLFVGLGNPGARYAGNRHNIGFIVLDALARAHHAGPWRKRFQGDATEVVIGEERIILLKPETFMNESGRAVNEAMRFYKIDLKDVFVFHDELDLAPGIAKLKLGGSSGGHNGLKDISAALGTQDYWRLRIGIGHPRSLNLQQPVVDFVLHRPRAEELVPIERAIDKSLDIIPLLCEGKPEQAMHTLHTAT